MATIDEMALQLVRQLHRNNDQIPSYNDELVRKCINEIRSLYNMNAQDVMQLRSGNCDSEQEMSVIVQTRQAMIERIKRCLIAYHYHRIDRLKKYRWDYGGILPTNVKACLCEAEIKWFQEYSKNLADYQSGLGESGGVDLTMNMEPPKSLFLRVRCIKEYGEFETADGTVVTLIKNSLHSLPRQDCEPLIKQGILQSIT